MSKTCNKCNVEKDLKLFHVCSDAKDGKNSICKVCVNTSSKKYDVATSGNFTCLKCQFEKDFTEFYPDGHHKRGCAVYCRTCCSNIRKLDLKNNPGKSAESSRKRRENPVNKIRMNLGTRLWQVVNKKHGNTMELVGCSTEELCIFLESEFSPGMTFENYGEWHIDHIRPCASFNLEDPEDQKKCFHWTNLQPLWAIDNIRKSDKWT
jgi:hypothetical protein